MADNLDIQSPRMLMANVDIQERAALYPEPLQEPFIWLCVFFRDQCSREIELLESFAKKHGVMFDRTTWSKIIRGKWNRDSKNNILPNPIVALDKLLNGIAILRRGALLKAQGGRVQFVETSTSRLIADYIEKKRAPDRVNRFGMIVGETGNQKTSTFRHLCTLDPTRLDWLDATPKASLYGLVTDLARKYGCHPGSNYSRKNLTVWESINETKVIILENCQRFYDEQDNEKQPIFSYLQKLQEERDCCIIMSFTPAFEKTLTTSACAGFFEQFVGRAGGVKSFLRLPEYPPEADVLDIITAFGLENPTEHLAYCTKISRQPGRVRVLFEVMQDAKIRAESETRRVTIDDIKYAFGDL